MLEALNSRFIVELSKLGLKICMAWSMVCTSSPVMHASTTIFLLLSLQL